MRVNCVAPVAKTTKQRGCCSAAPEKKTQGSHQPGEPWVGHQEVAGVKGGNAGECHASHLQKHEATATVPHEKNPRSGGTGAESVSSLAARYYLIRNVVAIVSFAVKGKRAPLL
jgi:hypothetical protein